MSSYLKIRLCSGAVALLLLGSYPVRADCYDILGCSNTSLFSRHFDYLGSVANGPKCDFLYLMRNAIYKEHGYCFKTARARSEFSNDGCHIDNIAAVPLNLVERANIATIIRAERLKHCPAS